MIALSIWSRMAVVSLAEHRPLSQSLGLGSHQQALPWAPTDKGHPAVYNPPISPSSGATWAAVAGEGTSYQMSRLSVPAGEGRGYLPDVLGGSTAPRRRCMPEEGLSCGKTVPSWR